MRPVLLGVLSALSSIQADSNAGEEEAAKRMLSLHLTSLWSDRPLPVQPLPGVPCRSEESAVCSSSGTQTVDGGGYPTGRSPWAATFESREHALVASRYAPPAEEVEQLFEAAVRALIEGRFTDAQQDLHRVCIGGQMMVRSWNEQLNATSRPTGDAGTNGDARYLEGWVQECALLLRYMPAVAPNAEDHKRLMMLLHDLGSAPLLSYLLGFLSRPLIGVPPLADLAEAILAFGEVCAEDSPLSNPEPSPSPSP